MRRTYLYVDGESHFIRTQEVLRSRHGSRARLDNCRWLQPSAGISVWVDVAAKFVWDPVICNEAGYLASGIDRGVYFSSMVGGSDLIHEARLKIRNAGLEPQLFEEPRKLADQRDNNQKSAHVMIKPKGVDVGLAVRMMEDAIHDNYDVCLLFTSDIDYLPAIQSIRRMGKRVIVLGFSGGLGSNSPFFYAVDQFVDLTQYIRDRYVPTDETQTPQ